jgi:predicted DNA-binding transcriptional regulator YafY
MRDDVDASGLLVGPGTPIAAGDAELAEIRQAMRHERKLRISYVDGDGDTTRRTVWPIALGFFDRVRVVAAWCELRQDFRHFRTDRITALKRTDTRYPRRRRALLKAWRDLEGVPPPRS